MTRGLGFETNENGKILLGASSQMGSAMHDSNLVRTPQPPNTDKNEILLCMTISDFVPYRTGKHSLPRLFHFQTPRPLVNF